MSKWMTGCLVLLACLAVAVWLGYRKMASVASGPSPTVTIKASPDRVFASLANADSIPTWMAKGNTVIVHRRGPLVPGDTVSIEIRNRFGRSNERISWIVSQVVPGKLLALELRSDSTKKLLATRRDSLFSMGDSTRIVSTIVVAPMDSIMTATKTDEGRKTDRSMMQMTSKIMFSAFRIESQLELDHLKSRIEGPPVVH